MVGKGVFTQRTGQNCLNIGELLNDLHTSAAQLLLKAQFPKIGSLQSTLLGVNLEVQAYELWLSPNPGHWACVSTVGCDHEHVNLYESFLSTTYITYPATLLLITDK